ncbi:anti-repressor SinI family protein [Paenibacillus radicis (ex Xue et al. 2023)]|uniref:Anti-repressor SinI family protein n=1 Tax=Paenibacillus radicis (ex Xue et al. 2023) TaxID=2972489 RepID=A0ABT1YSU7_9BACL|nr:anti-repressor SinI family protein [Paenibacillus radicis (ex Xue et al. 2023)]MCR8635414.1 anti-repressor SinI family protein [Paenibacillus radicis (ex Xue et al. 2023)]
MNVANLSDNKELDEEWVELILAARDLELSIDEIRAFIKRPTYMAENLVHLIVANQDIPSHKPSLCNDVKEVGSSVSYEYT